MTTRMDEQAGVRRGGLSLDALVLVLVTAWTLHLNAYNHFTTTFTTPAQNAVAVGLLGLYLAIDVLGVPLATGNTLARRLFYGSKGAVLAAIIALVVVWPTCSAIGLRHADGPATWVHDTSVNVEAATRFLLAGKDPYAQTYFHTPLAQWGWDADHKYNVGPNPALWWTDTFPGQELVTVPFMLAGQATIGWFDERFIYMAAFGLTLLLLLRLAPTATTRLALVAGVALNPLWVSEFIYGQNDILVLAEVLVVLSFSLRERWRLALIALAVACATKQTILLLLPFYLWWLALRIAPTWPARLERLALLLPWLAVPLILAVGPFVVWDPLAFYNGNFAYVAGTIPHSYPIQGYDAYGAASFVLWGGLVPNAKAYFPFSILEAALAVPLTLLLLRRFRPSTPATVMLAAFATVLLPIFYLSRFFHASYAAFTISLLLVAYFAHRPAARRSDDGHLSFDLLALLLLVPQVIEPPTNRHNALAAAAAFGLLLAYLLVTVFAPWSRVREGRPRALAAAGRALNVAGLAEVTVFSRAIAGITDRIHWYAPGFSAHDTGLQVWLSAGALLNGHNPYAMTFQKTALFGLFNPAHWAGKPLPRDLPVMRNAHLPLEILLGAAGQALFNALHLFFDEGYIYVLALLVAAALLPLLVRHPARQLALLISVVFSPLFATGVIFEHDDVPVLLALVVGLVLLQRGRNLPAMLAFGVAVALKLTAWPVIPFLIVYLAATDRDRARSVGRRVRSWLARLALLALPLAVSAYPFARWNAPALWDNAIGYPLGLIRDALPLDITWGSGFQTLGFGRIALDAGWAHADGSGYIGPLLAGVCGVVVFALVSLRLWQRPSLPLLMGGYLVLLFALEYFGRFMVDTSLGYLAALAPLSFFLAVSRSAARATAPLPLPVAASGADTDEEGQAAHTAAISVDLQARPAHGS